MTPFAADTGRQIRRGHYWWVWVMFSVVASLSDCAFAEFSEKVVEKARSATVRVVVLVDGDLAGHGTGFIVTRQGHIVTNRHVVEGGDALGILYCEGDRFFARPASLVGLSSDADIAILKIDPIRSAGVAKIATADLVSGQGVMTVGFPGALDDGSWATLEGVDIGIRPGEGSIASKDAKDDFVPAVFAGAVAKMVTEDGVGIVLHSAKISPGNSGGPLIDEEGRVCGINTALVPAGFAGSDYPISIHVSALIELARRHGVTLALEGGRATPPGAGGVLMTLFIVAIAALAIVTFLLVLRRPRMALAHSVSRLTRSRGGHAGRERSPQGAALPPGALHGRMRLRGRDQQGRSFDLAFDENQLKAAGGRLVIGRNPDLCQLHLPHDSVSRQHTTLSLQAGGMAVEDRNSGNGTFINGQKVALGGTGLPLRSGDRLTLGEVDLVFDILN